ncbi:MAG: hypothetical protein AAF721_26340 [Myxococcota bacterium]
MVVARPSSLALTLCLVASACGDDDTGRGPGNANDPFEPTQACSDGACDDPMDASSVGGETSGGAVGTEDGGSSGGTPEDEGDAGDDGPADDDAADDDAGDTTEGPTDDNPSDTDEAWVQLVSPAGAEASGIHYKEIAGASGSDIFIGYGGYSVQQSWAEAWVDALFEARLAEMGVRHLVAVTGPNDPGYDNLEIGNTKLAATLVDWLDDPDETNTDSRIIIAAHSSGAFVAHELFAQLVGSHDPDGLTAGRITYFDLDGAQGGLNAQIAEHWHRGYFVYAVKHSGGSEYFSQNVNSMLSAGANFGETMEISADDSGCNNSAGWCLHDTVINTRPHNPATFDLELDYTDFADAGIGRAVAVEYIDNATWD